MLAVDGRVDVADLRVLVDGRGVHGNGVGGGLVVGVEIVVGEVFERSVNERDRWRTKCDERRFTCRRRVCWLLCCSRSER